LGNGCLGGKREAKRGNGKRINKWRERESYKDRKKIVRSLRLNIIEGTHAG